MPKEWKMRVKVLNRWKSLNASSSKELTSKSSLLYFQKLRPANKLRIGGDNCRVYEHAEV